MPRTQQPRLDASSTPAHGAQQRVIQRSLRIEFLEQAQAVHAGVDDGEGLNVLVVQAVLDDGYDHSSVGRTKTNGQVVAGSVRTQLGTLLLGYSYRLSKNTSLSVSVGAGLTTARRTSL